MAYRRLNLDVRRRTLRADDEVTICREFTVGGEQESIRRYMDPADYDLLNDFDADSLDIVDMVMTLEDEFGIEVPDDAIESLHTVGDVVRFVDSHLDN